MREQATRWCPKVAPDSRLHGYRQDPGVHTQFATPSGGDGRPTPAPVKGVLR